MSRKQNNILNPRPSRTSQVLEAVGIPVDRSGEVPTRKKIAAWALGVAAVGTAGNAVWERLHSDEPVPMFSSPVEVESEAPISGQGDLPEDPKTTVIEARPGDTIWTITRRVRPDDGDIRPEVDSIVSDRGGASLQVGDEVKVPVDNKG